MVEQLARLPVEVDYGASSAIAIRSSGPRRWPSRSRQSGETADTLAALREAGRRARRSLAICNVVELDGDARDRRHASTRTPGRRSAWRRRRRSPSQLVALHFLALYLAQVRGTIDEKESREHIEALAQLPAADRGSPQVRRADRGDRQALLPRAATSCILGRGISYPIALEGALKLKEISYIHAEGYPAGEMKHGPIALIDEKLPVLAIAPQDAVFEKMLGNIQEAKARGGMIIALATKGDDRLDHILDPLLDSKISLPAAPPLVAPVVTVIPLQLLSYHIAVRRGCDVDQPRNLAKSVTVE